MFVGDRSWTYGELEAASDAAAADLVDSGVAPGRPRRAPARELGRVRDRALRRAEGRGGGRAAEPDDEGGQARATCSTTAAPRALFTRAGLADVVSAALDLALTRTRIVLVDGDAARTRAAAHGRPRARAAAAARPRHRRGPRRGAVHVRLDGAAEGRDAHAPDRLQQRVGDRLVPPERAGRRRPLRAPALVQLRALPGADGRRGRLCGRARALAHVSARHPPPDERPARDGPAGRAERLCDPAPAPARRRRRPRLAAVRDERRQRAPGGAPGAAPRPASGRADLLHVRADRVHARELPRPGAARREAGVGRARDPELGDLPRRRRRQAASARLDR